MRTAAPQHLLVVVLLFVIGGCGPGVSDFNEDIGKTGYRFEWTDSINKAIRPDQSCGLHCPSIEPKVIAYDANPNLIAAVRQDVNYYYCKEDYISLVITADLAYWVIDLNQHQLIGPMTERKFSDLRLAHSREYEGIKLPTLSEAAKYMTAPRPLSECSDPKLVAAQPVGAADAASRRV